MEKFALKIKSDGIYSALASAYVTVMLTAFLLLVPCEGYSVIADFKYALFLIFTLAFIALFALLFALRSALGVKTEVKKSVTPAGVFAAAYLLLTALSAALSPYGAETLLGGTRRDGLLTVALYVISFLILSRHFRPKSVHIVIFACSVTVFCAVTLLQFAGFNPLSLYPGEYNYYGADIDYAGTYIGTVGNADLAAPILAGGAALFIAYMAKSKDPRRFLLLIPTVFSLYILLKTGVSSALLALAVYAVFAPSILVSDAKLRKKCLIFGVILTVFALIFIIFGSFSDGFFYEFSEFLHGRGRPEFGSGRLSIWSAALKEAEKNLLIGTGPDTFRFLGLKFEWAKPDGTVSTQFITAAHNDYLNILINQGLPALISFLGVLLCAAVRFIRGESKTPVIWGSFAFVFALQAFFGVSMPVNTPFLWIALAAVESRSGKTSIQ